MYCAACGAEITHNDRFCRKCGGTLAGESDSTPSAATHATAAAALADPAPGADASAARKQYRRARRAHLKKRWDEATEGYQKALALGPDPKTKTRTELALALVAAQKRPNGTLGFWAVGIVAAPVILMGVLSVLPPAIENTLALFFVSLMSLGQLAAIICAIMGLFFQRGTANRFAAAIVLAGFAFYFWQLAGMGKEKQARIVIMEGMAIAQAARVGIAEFYAANGRMPASNAEANVAEPDALANGYVRAMTVGPGGSITIEYKAANFSGQTIIFRPLINDEDYLVWDCYGGTVPHKYRAPNCRVPVLGDTPNARGSASNDAKTGGKAAAGKGASLASAPSASGTGANLAATVEKAIAADDYASALEPATRLAEAGDRRMQFIVADIYRFGRGGIEPNPIKAFEWMEKAANAGEQGAQINVALMYDKGEGVAADPVRAFDLFLDIAHTGEPSAQNQVGYYYASGKGTNQDLAEAFYWFERAANEGYAPAMTNLGIAYKKGRSVTVDSAQARSWFAKAAELGDERAKKNLELLDQ